jgi:DNA-binding transcriptional regulator YdaS (Cro superfamily)
MDKKLSNLRDQLVNGGAPAHLLNTVMAADKYTGILKAVSCAGGITHLAKQLGVSHQCAQQWLKRGFVPLARIPEIETLYGVPRNELMNPKYAAALAEPNFSSDV